VEHPSVLIAGIGNIFFRDDGFGVEAAHRLAEAELPPWVQVTDYGIRGLHLALDLSQHEYEMALLIDAAPRGGRAGSVYLIEPDLTDTSVDAAAAGSGHGMSVDRVFALVSRLGGIKGRVLVVGCEPLDVESGIGLSAPVREAIDEAVKLVRECIEEVAPCA
jgi:hydrogenase maturation protease